MTYRLDYNSQAILSGSCYFHDLYDYIRSNGFFYTIICEPHGMTVKIGKFDKPREVWHTKDNFINNNTRIHKSNE